MVTISKEDSAFVFEIEGWHKLWSLKSSLRIPVAHIGKVYRDDSVSTWVPGLRLPGTQIPGVISAGTFITMKGLIFCDLTDPSSAIVVELHDEHYKKLIIDVHDPEQAIRFLSSTD